MIISKKTGIITYEGKEYVIRNLPDCIDSPNCPHKLDQTTNKCLLFVHIPSDKLGCKALRFPNAPEKVNFT